MTYTITAIAIIAISTIFTIAIICDKIQNYKQAKFETKITQAVQAKREARQATSQAKQDTWQAKTIYEIETGEFDFTRLLDTDDNWGQVEVIKFGPQDNLAKHHQDFTNWLQDN